MEQSPVPFTKMHGLGNDFIVINAMELPFSLEQFPIKQLADRHRGIGFDQLLVIEPGKETDFFCRIFNADGSEAEQCGNGLRCVARYLHEEKISNQDTFTIATKAGSCSISLSDYDHIKVIFASPDVPQLIPLDLSKQQIQIYYLTMGNPHAILKIDDLHSPLLNTLGPAIAAHPRFSRGVNVGFMQVIDDKNIKLRTYERGSGFTNACGSNACAAVYTGIFHGWLNHEVKVEFELGELSIRFLPENDELEMNGPAVKVFSGII